MDMNKYVGSKYLGATDYPRPVVLTIEQVSEELIGEDKKEKSILYFEKVEKALVLNKTNIALLIDMMGTADSDHWVGRSVEVYTDPNVLYAGKRTPALRVRTPQPRAAAPHRPGPPAAVSTPADANLTTLVTDDLDLDSIPDPGPPMSARQRQAATRF